MINKVYCIRIFFVVTVWVCSSCSYKTNYAPVRKTEQKRQTTPGYYTVKKGDTLYSIGFRYGYNYLDVAKWNEINKPYSIHVGQKLRLFRPIISQSRPNKTPQKDSKKRPVSQNSIKKRRNSSQKIPIFSNTKKKMLKFTWQWPIRGKLVKTFSQTGNKGIDIRGKIGQSVKAAADGKVVYSGNGLIGYGNLLIIKHNYLYLSAYANNRQVFVAEGQNIRKGQIIAEIGSGKNKQAALHFEIRKNGESVNPLSYLPKL